MGQAQELADDLETLPRHPRPHPRRRKTRPKHLPPNQKRNPERRSGSHRKNPRRQPRKRLRPCLSLIRRLYRSSLSALLGLVAVGAALGEWMIRQQEFSSACHHDVQFQRGRGANYLQIPDAAQPRPVYDQITTFRLPPEFLKLRVVDKHRG